MSVEPRHTKGDLRQMQSVPLAGKILMTKRRIREWYDAWDGQVYVSFSGGKDSTVLKHIVDSMYSDVPAVFVNTGLEYPEIQQFVRDVKAGNGIASTQTLKFSGLKCGLMKSSRSMAIRLRQSVSLDMWRQQGEIPTAKGQNGSGAKKKQSLSQAASGHF